MNFNAQPSAIGYLYQVRYALWILLNADRDETELAIEKLDDISFEEHGSAVELLQTKHHLNAETDLTDTSTDLWKTIRIWSHSMANNSFNEDVILTLVTTSSTPTSSTSITRKLKPMKGRDNKSISQELVAIAQYSKNKALQEAFSAYLGLSDLQKEKLVQSIQIVDNSPDIQDTADLNMKKLQVRTTYRKEIYSRLEGWWFNRIINHLRNNTSDTINKLELINQIADISEQFRSDNLPIDFADVEPPEEPNADTDQRQFVNQLRVIGLQNKQIDNAIRDYYRAFEQRSRWEREQLLGINELESYEKKLINEWSRQLLWQQLEESYDENDEHSMRICGAELFKWAEESDYRIRQQVLEPYVMRGSFHLLANELNPRVWWHPKFVEKLKSIIDTSQLQVSCIKRPCEVENLFNPAFCAYMLHEAISGYFTQRNEGMPYALLFLVLPIILHAGTRNALPKRVSSKFHTWLTKNPTARIDFAKRTKDLVKITKEAIFFGIDNGYITITDNDKFVVTDKVFKTIQSQPQNSVDEFLEIKRSSIFIGRWYAKAGTVASIYIMWGIHP